jgi:putative oxidoreductase
VVDRISRVQDALKRPLAIFTTHISNGFAAGDNGFEIPLYYFLMLFALVVYGSGKYSLDYLIASRSKYSAAPA